LTADDAVLASRNRSDQTIGAGFVTHTVTEPSLAPDSPPSPPKRRTARALTRAVLNFPRATFGKPRWES
jgi:hypothetical protein